MRLIVPVSVATLLGLTLWWFAVPRVLGAHPWWADKVILFGFPGGALFALCLGQLSRPARRLVVFAVLTVIGFWIAKTGGEGFAASYAEDGAAGKRWFFGWIATMAAAGAVSTSLGQGIWRGVTRF